MYDLMDMAAFARVVEASSFSGAARELGVSKSAVSKQVSRLEDRLGVRLLNRTTRRLSLTEAGARFYEGCQRMLAEAEGAREAVTPLAAAPRGVLRVNAPMTFGVRHLSPALPALMARCPELSVDLVLNDRVVDLVEEGFDVGLRIGQLRESSLIARRLADAPMLVCAAPGYLERAGVPARPEDLGGHPCLIYSYIEAGTVWRCRSADGGAARVRVKGRLVANNGEALLAAARAGLGICRLPSFIVGDAVRAGDLVRLLPAWQVHPAAGIHAIYPAHRHLSPKVRVFVDFLAERFGAPPYWDRDLPLA